MSIISGQSTGGHMKWFHSLLNYHAPEATVLWDIHSHWHSQTVILSRRHEITKQTPTASASKQLFESFTKRIICLPGWSNSCAHVPVTAPITWLNRCTFYKVTNRWTRHHYSWCAAQCCQYSSTTEEVECPLTVVSGQWLVVPVLAGVWAGPDGGPGVVSQVSALQQRERPHPGLGPVLPCVPPHLQATAPGKSESSYRFTLPGKPWATSTGH